MVLLDDGVSADDRDKMEDDFKCGREEPQATHVITTDNDRCVVSYNCD